LADPIRVPYRSYREIGEISFAFLRRCELDQAVPVDIESILEFKLDIGIIPTPGFQHNHEVEGSLSLDMKTIYVDEHVYRSVETRYRFTLAHELGHIVLHRNIFKGLEVDSIIDWKRSYRMIDENVYYAIEKQAYDFAGLLLVPTEHLRIRFTRMVSENKPKFVEAHDKHITREKALFYFKSQAIGRLARIFNVSSDVMERRIDKDNLISIIFPDATDHQFADAYAQTIIFALLLARMEKSGVLVLQDAFNTLESNHLLLSRALQFLTDRQALKEIEASLSLAQRIIHEIPPESLLAGDEGKDPWLFFYEYFLSKYDPNLRKAWGVYYTPIEVVRCQVRLIDEILKNEFGKEMGFVEPGVITLDPGVGTGTYLLGIVEHALKRVEVEEGLGAVKGGARSLIHNLHGFEWMVGPYAVAQLRFSRALTSRGVSLPPTGIGIYLTNTLESPHAQPPVPPLFQKPIAQEHERALKIKDAEHVLVCLGNPPYGRHEAADEINHAVTGGWVRYGDGKDKGILEDFLEPARKAGFGIHLKNLYNQPTG
jgi:Zn-dependent peptidase ImmA (M78 family)